MSELKMLNLSELLDLLMDQTSYHTNLISIGATAEQFKLSEEILRELQAEISLRKIVEKTNQSICPSQEEPPLEMAN